MQYVKALRIQTLATYQYEQKQSVPYTVIRVYEGPFLLRAAFTIRQKASQTKVTLVHYLQLNVAMSAVEKTPSVVKTGTYKEA